jgi:hypothetical protein
MVFEVSQQKTFFLFYTTSACMEEGLSARADVQAKVLVK